MILVFGKGQLGQELAGRAELAATSLVVLPREAVDVTDRTAVANALARIPADVVVNAAAYTAVDKAEKEPDLAWRVNVDGAANIAAECARAGVPLIHLSTDYVFDGANGDAAYCEDNATNPLGVYGRTKLAGEIAVSQATPSHIILRTSWLYGRYGRNFLITMLRLATERDRIPVVADQYGCPTSTEDLAEAILRAAAAAAARASPWGTYHFAGQGTTTWHGFASQIVSECNRRLGGQTKVVAIGTADYPVLARRPPNSVLSSAKFTRTFAFTARHWSAASDATVAAVLSDGAMRSPAAA